jgi:hypothetical protein
VPEAELSPARGFVLRAHLVGDTLLPVRPAASNEALQQTRSALTTIAAALAAERRCSANYSGLEAE